MRLKEKLQGAVPEVLLTRLSGRMHIIGDIAILSIPPELDRYGVQIGQAALSTAGGIKSVFKKTSGLHGERRVASLEHLAGRAGTVTVHREYGHIYRLDVAEVFFNSRLGYERMRVASAVQAGEEVLLAFAGVGPFAVPLAARGASVLALEKSLKACLFLAENARLNRVAHRIAIVNGDALQSASLLKKQFDRAVLPAPYGLEGVIEAALPLVKWGGWLHYYTFKKPSQIGPLARDFEDMGLEAVNCRRCGNVAPQVSRWAFDLKKS
ncbi:MAG TPA: class I SAM-dependent methyltransferase family protein [Methanothrix sp.]|nr:class I SAM-dependent methyltransferase family protein [Methanothrix sp.]HPT19209.1 class I SAM-dependent methyltransferase family protein [Methanothrix sp.]